MKVRLIKWSNVLYHCKENKSMVKAFEDFRRRLKESEVFRTPQEIISSNPNSDLVTCRKSKQSRIVFNVGNNKYRMICGYLFSEKRCLLFIKFVGTHKEYDAIDVCSVNMFKK